ncbi:MAG: SAM-dependent methyltransferase, partial [Phycisphaeraceae bacterium]|nr:SAM-dependent methyltransferase [Phycisphaeraceae bacterium]
MSDDAPAPGRVTLIGAGPGDPQLITARGLAALKAADVVVYDALASNQLLKFARPDAELIDAGKRAKKHRLTQDQTNALLVEKARAGLKVARLKGGDPYLFGRGAEEVAYLGRQGVTCEVIPGITAGIAAPMTAG